ncbi:MAG: hypothetical protein OFPII_23820 [Osedax symbiont Rs1]|nr:MAG: hypothetical protein OFPII_23820 [Osedax symbiont Rs1]
MKSHNIFLVITLSSSFLAHQAYSLPQKAQIVTGSVELHSADSTLNIQQNSTKAIINWQGFDIQSHETVNIAQPSSEAVILNRVLGNNPTKIFGSLNANGKVFLVNNSGITFAKGSQVNVGALVASTLDIDNDDFLKGVYQFNGNSGTTLLNQGSLYAGTIALLGNQVINQGWIIASGSNDHSTTANVALLSADNIKLSFGSDKLLSVEIKKGTYDALVDNQQLILADGGQVLLRAEAAESLLGATVNNSGVIQARSIQEHEGRIILLADMHNGITRVSGTLDASATVSPSLNFQPRGGFIETSGAKVTVSHSAIITTKAEGGLSGQWLIDPNDIIIDNSGDAGTISASALSSNLQNNGNVSLQTTNQGSSGGNGDIFVNSDISWDSDGSVLTLQAENNINISAEIFAQGDLSGIELDTGLSYNTASNWDKVYSDLDFSQGNNVSYSTSGKITLTGADAIYVQDGKMFQVINGKNSTLTGTTAVAELAAIDPSAFNYALAVDIDASSISGPLGSSTNGIQGFDGLNHNIDNLTINAPNADNIALFSTAKSDTDVFVRNIKADNYAVLGKDNVSALIGSSPSGSKLFIHNISLTKLTLAGQLATGGLVGLADNATISDSNVAANISGLSSPLFAHGKVGGLAGDAFNLSVSNSHVKGSIVNNESYTGGIVGSVGYINIQDSTSKAVVTGSLYTGGLVGNVQQSINIQNSGNYGKIKGENYTGGLLGLHGASAAEGKIIYSYNLGSVTSSGDNVGGLIGIVSNSPYEQVVEQSFVNAIITGRKYVGGLIGFARDIELENVYFSGNVIGESSLGGLVGRTAMGGSVNNAYVTGSVTSTLATSPTTMGMLFGLQAGSTSIGNLYWDSTQGLVPKHRSTSVISGSVVEGRTISELKQQSKFGGFDLISANPIWKIIEGQSMPGLVNVVPKIDVIFNSAKIYDGALFTTSLPSPDFLSNNPGIENYIINPSAIGVSTKTKNVGSFSADDILLTGFNSSQYALNFDHSDFTLKITPKTITAEATGPNKTYDGNTSAISTLISSNDFVVNDDVSLSFTGSLFSDKNAGVNKTVTTSGISLSGTDAANYLLGATSVAHTADINAVAIDITATSEDKVYDGSDAAITQLETNNILNNDAVKLLFTDSKFTDKSVGTNKTVTTSGLTLTGIDANNYYLAANSVFSWADIKKLIPSTQVTDKEAKPANAPYMGNNHQLPTKPIYRYYDDQVSVKLDWDPQQLSKITIADYIKLKQSVPSVTTNFPVFSLLKFLSQSALTDIGKQVLKQDAVKQDNHSRCEEGSMTNGCSNTSSIIKSVYPAVIRHPNVAIY